MRLKVGFILRSLLVVGTFLGLVVLWSSLSPKPSDDNPFEKRVSAQTLDSGGKGISKCYLHGRCCVDGFFDSQSL